MADNLEMSWWSFCHIFYSVNKFLSQGRCNIISSSNWVTLTFDLAFRSAIRWAKP